MITRKITHELTECAAEYPAVTILGPRQSGKTTLAKMTFSERPYVSLEDPDVRRQAIADPRGLLDGLQEGAILDEFNVCRNSSAIYKVLSMQIENRAALFSLVLISPWFMRQSLSHWLDARPCWN